jgi:hypothetical protein
MEILNKKYISLDKLKDEFYKASPFPYIVLDDFLDAAYFKFLTENLQNNNDFAMGKSFSTEIESNKSISLNSEIPKLVSKIVDTLNTEEWVNNLIKLTGIETLVSSNNGNTMLANYHEMKSGGILGSHVDHSYEPELGIPHVLNIILYLSSDWTADFGGGTLFFNKNGSNPVSKVDYVPNRAVIFLHTPYSFHGVDRLKNNGDIKRKTLYVDYYSTSFDPFKNIKLPFLNHWFKHGTTFRLLKTSDYFKLKNKEYTKGYLKYLFNKFIS